MDYQDILVDVEDTIAIVTLNRPDKLNAYTARMGDELTQAYESLGQRNDVRAIIMTGAGRGFCAGADIGGMFQKDIEKREQGGGKAATGSGAGVVHPRSGLPYALHDCGKPTIAAINGPAVGIGLTLTLLQERHPGCGGRSLDWGYFRQDGPDAGARFDIYAAPAGWFVQSSRAGLHSQSAQRQRSV